MVGVVIALFCLCIVGNCVLDDVIGRGLRARVPDGFGEIGAAPGKRSFSVTLNWLRYGGAGLFL